MLTDNGFPRDKSKSGQKRQKNASKSPYADAAHLGRTQ